MNYHFVRVTDYYPQYLNNYYLKNPEVSSKPYFEQHKAITNDSFEIVSSYTKNLNKIDGIKAFDIISNATFLQSKWCEENNLPTTISKEDLIIHQLKYFKPTVLWIDDFSFIDKSWKTRLLSEVPSLKLLVGHICAPYNEIVAEKFKLFDLIFTCIPCFKKDLDKLGINSYLLYHGFEATLLERIKTENKFSGIDFLFAGSLYTGSGFHKSRMEYIDKMLRSGISMDLYCNLEPYKKVLVKKVFYRLIRIIKSIGLSSLIDKIPVIKKNKAFGEVPISYYSKEILKSAKPPVFGLEMYQLLSKSNIVFNIHGEVADKCAGNIRLFEATGVGACLVTDWKENIEDLFVPGKEIVTYKTVEECIEKVKWLLAHPEERKAIAMAGQKRTLENHTIEKRAILVHEVLKKELEKVSIM